MTKSLPLPEVKYTLICDDIREEKGNKSILIGVYTNIVYVPKIPSLLPKFCFRICFDASVPHAKEFNMLIKRPNKTSLGPFSTPIISESEAEAIINLTISPFIFEELGEYEVFIEEGKRQKSIYKFFVKK